MDNEFKMTVAFYEGLKNEGFNYLLLHDVRHDTNGRLSALYMSAAKSMPALSTVSSTGISDGMIVDILFQRQNEISLFIISDIKNCAIMKDCIGEKL